MSVNTTAGLASPVRLRAEPASQSVVIGQAKSAAGGSLFAALLTHISSPQDSVSAAMAGRDNANPVLSRHLRPALTEHAAGTRAAPDADQLQTSIILKDHIDTELIESNIEYPAVPVRQTDAVSTGLLFTRLGGSTGERTSHFANHQYPALSGDLDIPANQLPSTVRADAGLRPGRPVRLQSMVSDVNPMSRDAGNAVPANGNELPAAGRVLPLQTEVGSVSREALRQVPAASFAQENIGATSRTMSLNTGNQGHLDSVAEVAATRSTPIPIGVNAAGLPLVSKLPAEHDRNIMARAPASPRVETLFRGTNADVIPAEIQGRAFISMKPDGDSALAAFSNHDARAPRERHESAVSLNSASIAGFSGSSASQSTNSPLASAFSNTANVPLENSVAAQISDRLVATVAQGGQTARLQLSPADLGSLELHIRIQDDGAAISIQASNPQARELIEASLPRLREMFAEQGMNLVDVDVSGRQEGEAGSSESDQAASVPTLAESPTDVERVEQPNQRRGQSRLLDVLA